jgi:hypothetical protein
MALFFLTLNKSYMKKKENKGGNITNEQVEQELRIRSKEGHQTTGVSRETGKTKEEEAKENKAPRSR